MCYVPLKALCTANFHLTHLTVNTEISQPEKTLGNANSKEQPTGVFLEDTEELKLPEIWLAVKPEFLMQLRSLRG